MPKRNRNQLRIPLPYLVLQDPKRVAAMVRYIDSVKGS